MKSEHLEHLLNDAIQIFEDDCAKATTYCASGSPCYAVSETHKALQKALESFKDALVSAYDNM